MAKFLFKTYNLNGILINELIHFIDLFWVDVVNNLNDKDKIRVVIICKYDDEYNALSKFLLVDKSSKEFYIKHILNLLNIKNEYYSNSHVSTITFKYVIIKDLNVNIEDKYYDKFLPNKVSSKMKSIKGFNLPSDMIYEEWGDIVFKNDNTLILHYNNDTILNVNLKTNDIVLLNRNSTILSFKDSRIADNYFIRTIDNNTYHYIDDQLIIINDPSKKFKFITKSIKDKNINNNFITLDIETKVVNNNITPYCICYFDGETTQAFYLTDYESVDIMIKECLKSLLDPKFNKKLIYIHNLSLFDGIFLLGPLSELVSDENDIQILKRDNKIILIKVQIEDGYIEFRDSLLLLPISLKKLAKTFNKEDHQKDVFPYSFVDDNDLNYIGVVPEFKYFNNVSIEEYNNYSSKYNNNWSIKDEAIKYCLQDCISLYHVLLNFNKIYFDKFKMNIHKYPTLSSLSMGTFRTCFLDTKKTKIPVINGSMFKEIKAGYTGGATDLYIPEGENVAVYDVNSLYPTVMSLYPMPVGKPKKFEGDISLIDKEAFGFFEVEVTAPEYLEHPILQTRVCTHGGYRTISPLGTWNDMIFSEEMYNAMKYGYTFNILRGYLFDKQVIFKDFIDTLYEIKASVHKSDPMYLITKLIQNSNYGRWGLNYELADHYIVNEERFQALNRNINIDLSNPIELSNDKKLVGVTDHLKYSNLDIDDSKFNYKVSLPIAAAITAYARIFMSQFKNNPNFKLLYTDTDSAFIIGKLPDYLVGNKLGQFKLEYIFKKLVILAPKVYGGILEDGTELIKVKGLKADSINKNLNVEMLESLLTQQSSIEIPNTKFIRDFENRTINIRNDLYTLMVTDNKRKLIYRDGKLTGTTPLIINSNKEIIN